MGTPANLEVLAAYGADAQATPGDLVIAVEAQDAYATEALAWAESELSARAPEGGGGRPKHRARSLAVAARELDGANVALISVPGEYAALEAHRALSSGMHVFLFSDHVPLASEVELKRRGAELGLLVMGPECGTAMLGGIGLGFANVVRPGSVGIVAAAGTGAQESACLLDAAGVGVSHIVGVGGRDLSAEVGALMFRAGMHMVAADPGTDTLLLVSKSPTPAGVEAIAGDLRAGSGSSRRSSAGTVRRHRSRSIRRWRRRRLPRPGPHRRTSELERAVDARARIASGRCLLGLYSGGSLAHEAVSLLEPESARSPATPDTARCRPTEGTRCSTSARPSTHRVARIHGRPRRATGMLERASDDERVGCVLLDVVLGFASHPDPAGGLADAIRRASSGAIVIAHVCGTPDDPQDSVRQAATLTDAGAVVAPSNAAAARLALRALR